MRLVAGAAGVSATGLLHAVAAGAVVLAALSLAVPGVVEVPHAGRAVAYSVAFGLGCLRVPLESAGFHGVFAPLSGLLVTLWGLAAAVRRSAPAWPGPRPHQVAAVALAFSATCAAAAAGAGAAGPLDPSVPGAALAGLAWGALAAGWATRPEPGPGSVRRDPERLGGRGVLERLGRRFVAVTAVGPPSVAPGLAGAAMALVLAGAWFAVALVVGLAGAAPREVAGGAVLGLGAAPNAAAVLAAVGLGAPVDAVLDGAAFDGPVAESLSLWDWGGGTAPPHAWALVLAPLAASVVSGRLAATTTPLAPPVLRGLRNGAVLGAVLVGLGWAGELAATAAEEGESITFRLGFSPFVVFAAAVLWGVAGAYAGPRIFAPGAARSRVSRP